MNHPNNPNIPQNYHFPAPAPILPTSTLATVSLISGILAYVFLPVFGALVALITGYMARSETRCVPPKASGDGMAIAGIVLGWIQVGVGLVILLCMGAMMILGITAPYFF